ncbi:PPE domain-containing protein [Rhodococcus sp. SGAir0479]|uniref:PPE domain-containing protein n=1 Tax=Rhodococcus sp. SGAir0479 TaxID=2567884 RepID=UPI0010CD0707|nr:PPE domain-containing protein [Rhodococcus sp. SGAir0479]QCQ93170.1 PPE family protein [Rhodococcus sp. SGAir0479]
MTIGVTGVVWMPRGATVNSTTLTAGAGPVPLSAASPAWTAVAEAFTDAHATLVRVMDELRASWEGAAADAALARLAPFTAWAQQTAALAAETAGKASTEAGAYTTAALTMPSLPEITTVKTAKTAAYTTGGVLNGSAAAAEAADRAMDIRAGLVMEAYEAASSIVTTPDAFPPPPPLTSGATSGPAGDPGDVTRRTLENDFRADPVGTVAAAATAFAQNPAVAAAASQAGTVASTVSGAASAAANLGGAVLGGVGAGAPAAISAHPDSRGSGAGSRAAAGLSGAAGTGTSGTVAARAAGVTGGGAVPDGWAQAGRLDAAARHGSGVGAPPQAPVTADPAGPDAAAVNRGATPAAGAPVGAHRATLDSKEAVRSGPGYLRSFEHFADGRTVIPSVIGADLPEDGR